MIDIEDIEVDAGSAEAFKDDEDDDNIPTGN